MSTITTIARGKDRAPTSPLSSNKKTPLRKTRKPHQRFATTQKRCAVAVFLVALVLTGLSLTHLAEGTGLVTGCDQRSAFAMAIGIDLSFIAIEISLLNATAATSQAIAPFAIPAIIGTLILSAAMNALSFGAHSTGVMLYPAIGLGVAIPALIYCLTRTGAALWRACK